MFGVHLLDHPPTATVGQFRLDQSQLRHVGVGVTEPNDTSGTTEAGAASNRRVQFMILKVPDKDVNPVEFDL